MTSSLATTDIVISIIIATYNAGSEIKDCLQSINDQVFRKMEIVVVDGGSKDDTVASLQSYNGRLPLTWISEPDQGIYDALNKGARLARGKWIYFLGADDRLLPGFSELAATLKEEHTVYYGISKAWYRNGETGPGLYTGRFSAYRMAKNCLNHQAILYPAAVFSKYSYELQYHISADYALNIRVWGDKNFPKQYLPVTIVNYNMEGYSSDKKDELFRQNRSQLVRDHMGYYVYCLFLFRQFRKKMKGQPDL